MTKRLAQESFEPAVGERADRLGPGNQTQHRGNHRGPGPKCSGGDVETELAVEMKMRQNREESVIGIARSGQQSSSHFPLQHEDQALKPMFYSHRLSNNAAGYVVRKISYNLDRVCRQNGKPVEGQDVGLDDLKRAFLRRPLLSQLQHHVAIELDSRHPGARLEKKTSQMSEAGSDLDHRLVLADGGELDDSEGHALVNEKMLAERLLGAGRICQRRHGSRVTAKVGTPCSR